MKVCDIARLFGVTTAMPTEITEICIDSRRVKSGCLFVAVQGERFDGHDFMAQAASNGAAAILCQQTHDDLDVLQIPVKDTLQALAELAAFHREGITCPIIALTGSNGKTSVKEMIAAILPQPAHATPGNLNNHIGVPLSILQLKKEHRYAVLELGANHPGEIAWTAALVKPQVALINNIAPAHIEGFGSIDGVAQSKGEIYEALTAGGTAIINDDDVYANFWDNLLTDKKVLRFSLSQERDVFARDVCFDASGCANFTLVLPSGEVQILLQVPGEHSVRNALAAAACCQAVGITLKDIAAGLQRFTGVAGRMTSLPGKNQSIIIDDTYNANLRSVLTAVEVLAKRSGKRILVLGDLGEAGDCTQKHHEEIGKTARLQGIDGVMTCGRHSLYTSKAFGDSARHFNTQDELAQQLLTLLDGNTTVLVKGSRSSAMEKIVYQLVI